MKTSSLAIDVLKKCEAYKSEAYLDSGKVWTIGYGTTMINGKPVKAGMKCIEPEALDWFTKDLIKFEKTVSNTFSGVNLTQRQFDALVMFCYNNGSFAHAETLVKAIKKDPNDHKSIVDAFHLYIKVRADHDGIDNDGDGIVDEPGEMKVVKGLVNRRDYEIDWYFNINPIS
jgi:GH24 family phage-related lysozyme (muramidase)